MARSLLPVVPKKEQGVLANVVNGNTQDHTPHMIQEPQWAGGEARGGSDGTSLAGPSGHAANMKKQPACFEC